MEASRKRAGELSAEVSRFAGGRPGDRTVESAGGSDPAWGESGCI